MHNPTADEQLMLELTNEARANPAGQVDRFISDLDNRTGIDQGITDALRFFDVNVDMLISQMAAFDAVAPLAWNGDLAGSADTHSKLMIKFDQQSHNLPGEVGLVQRVRDAGYTDVQRVGENVFAYTQNPVHGHAGFILDWGVGPGGIQDPAGHRVSLLSAGFTEIGISILAENDSSTTVGPFVTTQHLGTRFGYDAQLVGVVIDDRDGDDFYDIGEGLGGVTVTATGANGTFTTTTWGAGGYQMELAPGSYDVTFSGKGLDGEIVQTVRIGKDNVKLDAEVGDAETSDNGPAVLAVGKTVTGTSGNDVLRGSNGNDVLEGGAGADRLIGGKGMDTASYVNSDGFVRVDLEKEAFTTGEAIGDTFSSIEVFQMGGHNDRLKGDAADNVFLGGGGSDRLYGRAGDDVLTGEMGWDMLYGNHGVDVMTGGGGPAVDRFIYYHLSDSGVGQGNRDIITDFKSNEDRIEISRFDADEGRRGNQEFDFIGDAAFTGDAGELRYEAGNGLTIVQADTDGDGRADFEIELRGVMDLVETDFLL